MKSDQPNALIIGSQGTVGSALHLALRDSYNVYEINQNNCDYSEASLKEHADQLAQHKMQRIFCCVGTLHNDEVFPEKKLADLDADRLTEYYRINSILPALCLRFFSNLLARDSDTSQACSAYVNLSAMVGSIEQNELGGWYGYRSSKAALNMLVKTASIEIARANKSTAVIVIHPGTTQGPLSKPFSKRVSKDKYYTPAQSAARILAVTDSLTPKDTGCFFNWDGRKIAW